MFFLLLSGLCDTFDGRVACMKKNRTSRERCFGVQIDSLSDLVAFGVLPGCIGIAILRASERFADVPKLRRLTPDDQMILYPIVFTVIMLLYILAAMVRLAWFNVLEAERSAQDESRVKTYTGLPVTSTALIFPTILLIQFLTKKDITLIYFGVMCLVAILFVAPIKIRKPGIKGLLFMVGIGAVEFILFLVIRAGLLG